MNGRHTWTVLLACSAMLASSALCAQTSLPTPPASVARKMKDETPCPRDDGGTAWHTICAWQVRSNAVSEAWEEGLDLNGVKLDAEARAKKITEMEAWLGRLVGLSRSSLADRFSEVMGEPIFAFLTRWRLQLAAESLLTSERNVESIAKDAGYVSASAFSHAFKRAFGKPPTIWRRRRKRSR